MAVSMSTPITFNEPQLDVSSLRGRSVLITGGAAGIGLACAKKIAEAGALVTISDLNEANGKAAAQDLSSAGHGVQFVQCDVRSYAAQVEMYKNAIAFGGGRIDVVIPNAGIIAEQNLFDMASESTPSLDGPSPPQPGYTGCEINLQAVYNTCYLAMHYFRLPRAATDVYSPSIVLISSLAGYVGYPSSSTYSVSKFGVRGLFYGIRDRAARETPSVRVNLVAPWYIETAMTLDATFRSSEAGMLLDIIGFAPMDRVVAAVLQFAADQQLHGRAAGVFPMANEDLGDDLEGMFSGMVLQKHMKDVMVKVARAMAAAEKGKSGLERTDSGTAAPMGICD
jgi:5'-hydroxyaverantin dehydrogenase